MSQMIAVPDKLACRLEHAARSQRTTVESLVGTILEEAIPHEENADDWPEKNARRGGLIQQRFARGLSTAEAQELDQLQSLAMRRLEAWDAQRLRDVNVLRNAVEQVVLPTK